MTVDQPLLTNINMHGSTVPDHSPSLAIHLVRRSILLFSGLAAFVTSGCSGSAQFARQTDTSPISVNAVQITFQSGLGDGPEVWRQVSSSMVGSYRALPIERAGYGKTPAISSARSACNVADEQLKQLESAGMKGPYILVGHSLGGLYQYVFALRYPEKVAGIVLLDPTHPHHWSAVKDGSPFLAGAVRLAYLKFSDVMKREFDDQETCLDSLRGKPFPHVPIRYLVRGSFSGLEAGSFESVVKRLEVDWSTLLNGESATRVAGSGHYIQKDQPYEVARAIAEVAQAVGSVQK